MIHRFAVNHRRLFVMLFLASAALCITGCGSAVSDAEGVLTVISLAFSTAMVAVSFIPGAAAITPILEEGQAIVAQLQAQFKAFVANPTETAYQNLMAFVTQLNTNLAKILGATGLPAALITKLGGIFNAVLTQIQNWVNLVENLVNPGATTASAKLEMEAAMPGTALHAQLTAVHESAKTFHEEVKTAVLASTGDAEVDAAFEKANQL